MKHMLCSLIVHQPPITVHPFLYLQAEAEMQKKVELIQQIRAMESVPIVRTKFVDLTETGRQGLLSEMSVAEV